MRRNKRGKVLNQDINLTNMIDIIFAILIVFLISAPLMSQGIKVNLPEAEAPTIEQKKLLKVSVDRSGKIFISDMEVRLSEFNEIFRSYWVDEMPVVINADESVNYGVVMKVVSLVQSAGVKQLGFLTSNPDKN